MALTIPNKEIVRRICHLKGATESYLLVDLTLDYVEVLTDIHTKEIHSCEKELKEWAGMKFVVYNNATKSGRVKILRTLGEKILPIKLVT